MGSNFKAAVGRIVCERGIDVIGTVQFFGMLNDLGVFNDEQPSVRNITRALNGSDELKKLISSGRTGTLSAPEVKSSVSAFTARTGYDRNLVSYALFCILEGAGLVPESFHNDEKKPKEKKREKSMEQKQCGGNESPRNCWAVGDWLRRAWPIIWKVGLAALGVYLLIKFWWILLIIAAVIAVIWFIFLR